MVLWFLWFSGSVVLWFLWFSGSCGSLVLVVLVVLWFLWFSWFSGSRGSRASSRGSLVILAWFSHVHRHFECREDPGTRLRDMRARLELTRV